MKVVINSELVTKIAILLFVVFFATAFHSEKAAALQIAVGVNDILSDAGNGVLSQKLINANPDDAGIGYLLAQVEAGKQMPAAKSSDGIMGRINIIMQEDRIYYPNTLDGGKLYRINTDGSDRQKLEDE